MPDSDLSLTQRITQAIEALDEMPAVSPQDELSKSIIKSVLEDVATLANENAPAAIRALAGADIALDVVPGVDVEKITGEAVIREIGEEAAKTPAARRFAAAAAAFAREHLNPASHARAFQRHLGEELGSLAEQLRTAEGRGKYIAQTLIEEYKYPILILAGAAINEARHLFGAHAPLEYTSNDRSTHRIENGYRATGKITLTGNGYVQILPDGSHRLYRTGLFDEKTTANAAQFNFVIADAISRNQPVTLTFQGGHFYASIAREQSPHHEHKR